MAKREDTRLNGLNVRMYLNKSVVHKNPDLKTVTPRNPDSKA